MEKTHESVTGKGSAFRSYLDVVVGNRSFLYFLYFEFCQILAIIPGALGMVLRKLFWPRLFSSCGKGVLFGTNVTVRHPCRIVLGDRVVITDGSILDGRSPSVDIAISLGDDVILSNNVMLSCKEGSITIGRGTGINAQTIVQSTSQCAVNIGEDGIIGQRCFIIGGGSYNIDEVDVPIRMQGIKSDGGVTIAENVWIGGNVTVLGGVAIGNGSVIGASSVVTKSIPSMSICHGIPAKIVKSRK